ncbi:MAG: Deoxyribonuclease, TatD family [Leptospirillum sp. Group II 'C75']|jgi:TatD DNase family protein|uniref:TatD family hydrolase n=1 Tax=Leptospirillum sp. Group II 'CF-1' TaxID=1660083 RepID=UPI0000F0CC81|nr:TatD family hydrolase [Leptospirillum sp. Group II 'CF-1']AKS24202.1 TatD family deoxyribonuclease [Leptospirillum sp. Group II 'CF-1']EAY56534.1 MAG: Deoxyribonuclease, TatD family [Leptospirillum rubarum]EIJ75664.1 MAG: Deoxyribonuclease, TatD family [Leptospirillum sp. Group II 'C75']
MTLPFIDSHAHLNLMPPGTPPETVLEKAREAGMVALVNVGTDRERSRESVLLATTFPDIYATVGLHPGDAHLWGGEMEREFLELAGTTRVVAIGETGLDFSYSDPPNTVQEASFAAHISLAHTVGLPLVIHCREAFDRVFSLLKEHPLPSRPGVFHCFTGGWEEAKQALDLGFLLSFSGIVTFKNAEGLRDVASRVPADRMMVETDCPYLAPVPYRGKTNEPSYLPETLRVLASCRKEDPASLAETLLDNTRRLFAMNTGHPG